MRSTRPFVFLLTLTMLLASACGSTSGQASATATPTRTNTPAPAGSPTAIPSATAVPRLELSTCPFKVGRGWAVGNSLYCYNLVVRENRADPNSPLLHLAVAYFKNSSATANDPVIYLDGGPGGGGVYDFAPYITTQNRTLFMNDRDLILIDQRGTGYSTPSLRCTETDALIYQTDVNVTPQQGNQIYNTALTQCRQRLISQGIDLAQYTTYNAAADLHDLITVLKLQQVNLWGISYGTRLAEEMMRSFPQGVRSVILDSSVPPSVSHLADPKNMARVFNVLWNGCQSNATCNSNYPNLQQTFYNLYAQLNAHPITFQATDTYGTGKTYTVLFHGDDLVNTLFTSFYVTSFIANDPKMIYALKNGDSTLLAQFYGDYEFDTSISTGLYYSVECAEDLNFATTSDYQNAALSYPAPIRTNQTIGFIGSYQQGCATWNVPSVPASFRQNITSSIPTLIYADEYDPVTPPTNGQTNAQGLSNGYLFNMPGLGHGAFSDPCADSIRYAFQDTPTTKPDSSCIATMQEPAWA